MQSQMPPELSNDQRKKNFIYGFVGWPTSHPNHAEEHRPLTVTEAYTGKDAVTKKLLFPDSQDRQARWARLCTNLIIEASVQQALAKNTGLQTLFDEGLIHITDTLTAREIADTWKNKIKDPRGFTNWLVEKNAIRTIEDDPHYHEIEEKFKDDKRDALEKIRATEKERERVLKVLREDPGAKVVIPQSNTTVPEHPWQVFVERNRVIQRYYSIVIPEVKKQEAAQESRERKGSDHTVKTISKKKELKDSLVGSLPDINRLSILPRSPELSEIFFYRLNVYNNLENALSEKDRTDFHRSPLKMGPHGLHDQKNYVALDEDVTPEAAARGVHGTIAELACLSREQFLAKEETNAIYKEQRRLEGDNHQFTVDRVDGDTVFSLEDSYDKFREKLAEKLARLVEDGKLSAEGEQAMLQMLSPTNPVKDYLDFRGENKDPDERHRVLKQKMQMVFEDFSTMQRVHHALGVTSSGKEWRQAWLEAAYRMNQDIMDTKPELRIAQPMQDIFFEMIAAGIGPNAQLSLNDARRAGTARTNPLSRSS